MATTRGSYGFEVAESGLLLDTDDNLERLRRLFLDGKIIDEEWGPGDPGDFDHGGWHILCHLAGGAGIARTASGIAWCAITHVAANDTYEATITYEAGTGVRTVSLSAAEGVRLIAGASFPAFVEGSSQGHIAARGVDDAPEAFNKWPRQRFDQDIRSPDDGGTVWEQWSTTRDLRPESVIGTSVLKGLLTLVACLGGRFIAAVARGRREHGHPRQLVALVEAGVLTADDAAWDVVPQAIPASAQDLLYEARPADALAAARLLAPNPGLQAYFMFGRRIHRWSATADVRADLGLPV